LATRDGEIVIDAIVLGGFGMRIAALSDGRKKAALEVWFQTLRQAVICLPWTDETAVAWGIPSQGSRERGFTGPYQGRDDRRVRRTPLASPWPLEM